MEIIRTLRSLSIPKSSWLLLFIFLLCRVPHSHSQEPYLLSTFLTGKDGLPQGYVSGIVQDKAGFIWIGTRNGLARFDGKNFRNFYHDLNDTTSIGGNLINNVFIDSKNRLWVNYEGAGLDVFYPETEKIRHLSIEPGLSVLKNLDLEVDGILEDISGNMLFNTFNHGIIKLSANNQLHYPLKNFIKKDEKVYAVAQNTSKHLYVLTNNYLYHFDEKQEPVSKALFTVPSFLNRSIQDRYGMFFTADSTLFISGLNGVLKYTGSDTKYTLKNIQPSVKKLRGDASYSLVYINKNEGSLTLPGTDTSYTFRTNPATSISSLLDRSGVLWVGTSGYGIQLVYLRHHSFQYHKYKPPFTATLIENYLHVPHNEIPKNLIPSENIYDLRWTYDKAETLWMSNKRNESKDVLQVYAYANHRFTRPNWHTITGEKIKSDFIYGLAADSKNNLWILEGDYTLKKLNPVTAAVQSFAPKVPFDHRGVDLSLFIDKQDNLWIASNYGLLYYREGGESYVRYSIHPTNSLNHEANRIINIVEDYYDENKLWMGSLGNGLICFDKKKKKFTSYTKKDGLTDNTIYGVMADGKGFLWCSTNHGIFRFDTRLKKARKYADENGAPDFEFNRFHHLRLPDGRFAFGGFEDYTVFDPLSLADDTTQPNVAIASWKINNSPADYREEESPLSQSINSLAEVHLNHLQNFLTFEVAALQYNQPNAAEYRYKLIGIDKDWVYNGNNNSFNYTALPPGHYTLLINAANASEIWSGKVKELRIIIDPPWWKTWWFYALVILAVLSFIYVVYRYRINQVLKLQQVRNRIAKDLHDEIGSTLSTISIYAKVVQQQINTGTNAQPLLTKISDNANQVQDAMSDIVWSINTKNDELESIINRMREHAIQLLEAKDYAVHFSFDDTLNNVKLNMEQRKDFYLIYKEALNNIAKYADGKNVWISLTESNGLIALTIKDDGKGFDINTQSQSGNGLHNMQSRAQALKGDLQIISENDDGTTVSLTFENK